MDSKFKIGDKVKFKRVIPKWEMDKIYTVTDIRFSETKQSRANVIELDDKNSTVFESDLEKV